MGRLNRVLGAMTRWGLGLCALLVVLLALYVSLGRQLAPLVAEYRNELQDKAEQALGMPVHIGALEGRWSGLAPVLRVSDLQLGEGASALRLDEVKLVPDLWASLKAREVRLAHIQLGGLQVILRENPQGEWRLEGLPKKDDEPFDAAQVLQRLQSGYPPAVWTRPSHPDLCQPRSAGQSCAAVPGTAGNAAGRPASGAQPAQSRQTRGLARRRLPSLSEPAAERVDWREGRLQRGVARLNAPTLRGAYADRKMITLDNLALSAWVRQGREGYEAVVDSLAANIGDTRWESHLQAQQAPATDDSGDTWHVQADRLDLTPITPLIDALAPLPDKLMTVVDALKVTGALRNVRLDIRPQAEGDQRLAFAANLDNVGFDAYHGAPAAGNVSGSISGDLGQGELRLDSDAFMLHLYPIFAKPWHYQKANARLTWALDDDGFTLIAPYIKVLGDEGKIAADFLIRFRFHEQQADYMDLRVGLTDGDGRYTAKYLPQVLSPALDQWLRSAIVKGAVDEGYFQYQGSLNHDAPDHSRSISLFFDVHDATLDFQPGWPQVRQVDGKVRIQDSGVHIQANQGLLLDTKVSDVRVDIPHVEGDQHSHLYLDGKFDGSLGDGLKILKQAPIGTGEIFAGWEGEGPLRGKVKLDIPLEHGMQPKVNVDFATHDARLKVEPPALELSRLKGDFNFDLDKGLSGKDISLQAFGKPVSAQIFAEGQGGQIQTRIQASGQVALKALTEWLQFKQPLHHRDLHSFPTRRSSDLPYQLQLSLGSRDNRLDINSSLKGLIIDLPPPFGKAMTTVRESSFGMTLQGAERRFDARYADLAQLAYAATLDKPDQGRGELVLGGGSANVPGAQGLRVRGRLETLDLEPWQQQMSKYAGQDPGGSARQTLQSVDLSIGRLSAFGTELNQAVVRLARVASAWDLRLDSREVMGNARLPDAKAAPMVVTLQTLRLPPADPQQEAADDAPDPLASFDPRKAPMLDLSIDKLYRGDDLFGSAAVKLRPTARGVSVNDINLDLKGLRVDGSAGWEGTPDSSASWYKGRVQGANLGDVLKAWGFAPTVTSRSFRMDVDGRWPGSPAWVSLKRFSGSLDAALRTGQFVEVEGGAQALRVFGLLNFNSIGRRLRLDFTDLFGQGLAYDRVKGLLVASEGVYVTRKPIAVTGPSSNFELDGTLDLVRDRIDANLQVTLPVTNNLPLAALIVGAPAVGGALFLVDRLIGDRVARFASVHYRVQGPVKEPKITFVKPFDK